MNCPCEQCKHLPIMKETQSPNSLAFSGCQKTCRMKYCDSFTPYKVSIQPQCSPDVPKGLNHMGIKLDEKAYQKTNTEYCGKGYIGCNPILVDAPRAQRLVLDRPNYTGEMCVGDVPKDDIYSAEISKIGKGATSYEDLYGGQIQYYVAPGTSDPYFEPIFVTPAFVEHTLFRDPMGVVRPEYKRVSLKPYAWSECSTDRDCDSFTHDTLEFRQELMEKQMRKINEQKYDTRWYS